LIIKHVIYSMKPGTAQAFYEEITKAAYLDKTRAKEGVLRYEMYYPAESKDEILLLEVWLNEQILRQHNASDEVKLLYQLKEKYVLSTHIQQFEATQSMS